MPSVDLRPIGVPADESDRRWRHIVAVIATMPDVITRLGDDHVPAADGRCRTCTVPGRGTPGAPWPCVLAVLARDARAARRENATTPA